MLNIKEELATAAELLGCQVSDLIVSCGAALYLHGIRKEFQDIDVEVIQRIFTPVFMSEKYPTELFGTTMVMNVTPNVAVHIQKRKVETVEIDGIYVYSLTELSIQKLELVRHPERDPQKITQDNQDLMALMGAITNELFQDLRRS